MTTPITTSTTSTARDAGQKIATKRQISLLRCNVNHSGNRTFSRAVTGWTACAGCGNFVSDASIIDEEANPVGSFTGGGGYYRIGGAK